MSNGAPTRPAESFVYDPFASVTDDDPAELWRRMRDEAPLYRNDFRDFWALSRYDDIKQVIQDHGAYSSARGNILEVMDLPDGQRPRFLSFIDEPEHRSMRALVANGFGARSIRELEPDVRRLTAELLDPLVERDEFDYIGEFGGRLTIRVVGDLLGVPEADRDLLIRWTHEHTRRRQNGPAYRPVTEMRDYFAALGDERRRRPRNDFVTALTQAEVRPAELADFVTQLAMAGETTVALFASIARGLAAHPSERQRVVENPSLIPSAIEELLRFDPPLIRQARSVTRAVEWYGQQLIPGARLLLVHGAANRDERVFPDPDRFDVGRSPNPHLSFSGGIHRCLGAPLARLEGRIALEETLRRFPAWDVDPARTVSTNSAIGRSFSSVMMVPHRRSRHATSG